MKKYRNTLIFCYFGYVTQSIVVNLAPLFFVIFQRDYSFSYSFLAQLVLYTFLIQMAVDMSAVKFMGKIGYRRTALISQASSFIGLVLMGVLPKIMPDAHAAILISVLFYSIGGGLVEVVISPIVDALPSDAKESSMVLLHSFYSWGQVLVIILSTVIMRFIGDGYWYIIPLVWSILPIVDFIGFTKVPIVEPEPEERGHLKKDFMCSKVFFLVMFMMICSGAAEQIMAQWASLFCERGLGVTKVVGDLMGPCMFAALMGVGRTLYGVFGAGINLRRSLAVCSALTIVCYLSAVSLKNPYISLAGCAFCGLGVSLMWPGMLSLSSSRFPKGGAAMFAMLALGGDIGCSVGPFLTGIVSDAVTRSEGAVMSAEKLGITVEQLSLNAGILSGIIFPICLLIGTLLMKGKVKNHE